jgi:cytochrome P450
MHLGIGMETRVTEDADLRSRKMANPIYSQNAPELDQNTRWEVVGNKIARVLLVHEAVEVVPFYRVLELDETKEKFAEDFMSSWFSRSPQEVHKSIRSQLAHHYNRRSLVSLKSKFLAIAEECLRPLEGKVNKSGRIDECFKRYALMCTAATFSIPNSQLNNLEKVIDVFSRILEVPGYSESAKKAVEQSANYLHSLLVQLLTLSDELPGIQLIKELRHSSTNFWSVVADTSQLLTAGYLPTIQGIKSVIEQIEHGQLCIDTNDPENAYESVIEEVLRLNPPFPYLFRWVTQDFTLEDETLGIEKLTLKAGDRIAINISQVNRDASLFEEPNHFNPNRSFKHSLSFGYGSHRCIGGHLALMEIKQAVRAYLNYLTRLNSNEIA